MAAYDDVDLLDMEYVSEDEAYYYPCPCGDQFFVTVDDLIDCEEMAPCPSCSLLLHVIYDPTVFFESLNKDEESGTTVEKNLHAQQSDHKRTDSGGRETDAEIVVTEQRLVTGKAEKDINENPIVPLTQTLIIKQDQNKDTKSLTTLKLVHNTQCELESPICPKENGDDTQKRIESMRLCITNSSSPKTVNFLKKTRQEIEEHDNHKTLEEYPSYCGDGGSFNKTSHAFLSITKRSDVNKDIGKGTTKVSCEIGELDTNCDENKNTCSSGEQDSDDTSRSTLGSNALNLNSDNSKSDLNCEGVLTIKFSQLQSVNK